MYCSNEEIIPYIPDGIEFLKRDEKLDGYEVKGLDIIEAFVNDIDADIYIITHVTQPFTKGKSIIEALDKVKSGAYDSAFSAVELQDYMWYHEGYCEDTGSGTDLYGDWGFFHIYEKSIYRASSKNR